MVRGMFKKSLGATVAIGAIVVSSAAFAGGFALREQSATGEGLSFAGVAAGTGGVSSAFWNPATITMNPGYNGQQNFTLIAPSADIKTTGSALAPLGNAGDIGQAAIVPAGAASFQINDKLYVGIVSGAPFGLVTKPNQTWAGQLYSRTSKVFSVNATPMAAYRINDMISIGAGVQIQYFKTTLKSAAAGAPNASSAILEGDNTGVGFTAGVTLTPMKGTTVGIGYRSSIKHQLSGTLGPAPGINVPIKTSLSTPDMVSVGLTQEINNKFSVSATAEWTNWSKFGTFPVYNSVSGARVTTLPFEYKDGWFFALGGEYKHNDNWTFRTGLGYEVSPIRESNRGTRLPDNDRIWASLGASYKLNDNYTFDVAYSHIFVKSTKINLQPGNPGYNPAFGPAAVFRGDVDSSVDIVSVALRYHFGDPIKKEAPLVRKY